MKLPLLLSVPHAGWRVPPEAEQYCNLEEKDIIADGDEYAKEIYWPLKEHVAAFVTTDIARAIVDMNRSADDFSKDGAIKTHTCWDVPVYSRPLPDAVSRGLLERYRKPYHAELAHLSGSGVILGADCHTMATVGPPIGPDTGKKRPAVCLSDVMGDCPREWTESMQECFQQAFGPHSVTLNDPFTGGYITCTLSSELPWVQIELSRAPFMSNSEKTKRVLEAFQCWCAKYV